MKIFLHIVAVVVLVTILLFLPGCNGNTIQPPQPDPEFFADISGYDSVHFESVVMSTINIGAHQYQFSGFSKINNKEYGLLISIFYLDTALKTGTYNFRSTYISNQEYAVGSCIIGKGKDEKVFTSDSGTVIITELNGLTINGTFNFFASDTSKTEHISVQNGILKIK